ncbi:MAG: (2Fe-2S)-binding protein [Burkholderiales bacterium]
MTDSLRIHDGVHRGPAVTFRFDGNDVSAHEGESVAAALWAAGIRTWGRGPRDGMPAPRTLFCAMAMCQQCAVWIDGARYEACRTPVRAGLDVRSTPDP